VWLARWTSQHTACDAPMRRWFLELRTCVTVPKPWCEIGHEIACTQVELPIPLDTAHFVNHGHEPLQVLPNTIRVLDTKDDILHVQCVGGLQLAFHLSGARAGSMASMCIRTTKLVMNGPIPCFWRAPTDNDRGGEALSFCARWRNSGIDRLEMVRTIFFCFIFIFPNFLDEYCFSCHSDIRLTFSGWRSSFSIIVWSWS